MRVGRLCAMTAGGQSPTVRRRRLGMELKRLRESAGLTCESAGAPLEWSASKVSRIENGRSTLRARDVRDLLEVYGVSDATIADGLLELLRDSGKRAWWSSYGDVMPDPYRTLIGLEGAAASIWAYQSELVPGLLQTEDYARALIRASGAWDSTEDIDRRVEVRMARQAILDNPQPPRLWAVVNEAVVRRPVGGSAVMKAQLQHLTTAAERPNIDLQVLPFSEGAHPAMDGPFMLLKFADQGDPDVVYLENARGGLWLEKSSETTRYTLMFEHVRARALSPERSIKFILRAAEELAT